MTWFLIAKKRKKNFYRRDQQRFDTRNRNRCEKYKNGAKKKALLRLNWWNQRTHNLCGLYCSYFRIFPSLSVFCVFFFHHLWHMTNRTKRDAFKQNHVKWYNIHHQASFIFRMARAFFSLSVSQFHLNKPGTKVYFSFSECLCIVNRQTFLLLVSIFIARKCHKVLHFSLFSCHI